MAFLNPKVPAPPPTPIKANSDVLTQGKNPYASIIGGAGSTIPPLSRKPNTQKTTLIGGA